MVEPAAPNPMDSTAAALANAVAAAADSQASGGAAVAKPAATARPSMAASIVGALGSPAARRAHQALGPYIMAAPKRGVIGNSSYADRLRRSIVKAAKDKDGQKWVLREGGVGDGGGGGP